jgi:hypothetical protein
LREARIFQHAKGAQCLSSSVFIGVVFLDEREKRIACPGKFEASRPWWLLLPALRRGRPLINPDITGV